MFCLNSTAQYIDHQGEDSDGFRSLSSFKSISTDAPSSSALTVSESGSDSD